MFMDMLEPQTKIRRVSAHDAPKELPEHALEIIVEPGVRREIVFIDRR